LFVECKYYVSNMSEKIYSVNEILDAIDELRNTKKKRDEKLESPKKSIKKQQLDIPSNTLRLIEEAEKKIKSNLKSE